MVLAQLHLNTRWGWLCHSANLVSSNTLSLALPAGWPMSQKTFAWSNPPGDKTVHEGSADTSTVEFPCLLQRIITRLSWIIFAIYMNAAAIAIFWISPAVRDAGSALVQPKVFAREVSILVAQSSNELVFNEVVAALLYMTIWPWVFVENAKHVYYKVYLKVVSISFLWLSAELPDSSCDQHACVHEAHHTHSPAALAGQAHGPDPSLHAGDVAHGIALVRPPLSGQVHNRDASVKSGEYQSLAAPGQKQKKSSVQEMSKPGSKKRKEFLVQGAESVRQTRSQHLGTFTSFLFVVLGSNLVLATVWKQGACYGMPREGSSYGIPRSRKAAEHVRIQGSPYGIPIGCGAVTVLGSCLRLALPSRQLLSNTCLRLRSTVSSRQIFTKMLGCAHERVSERIVFAWVCIWGAVAFLGSCLRVALPSRQLHTNLCLCLRLTLSSRHLPSKPRSVFVTYCATRVGNGAVLDLQLMWIQLQIISQAMLFELLVSLRTS